MDGDLRIREHPYLSFQSRGRAVRLTFDGKEIEAYEDESIGAALHASGFHTLNRSFKYHRPRGLYCMSGRCPNCAMRVNAVPSVRVCIEPARDGTIVESQNSYPTVANDAYALMDRLDFMFPIGFQYIKFIRPRLLWPLYEKVIRKLAGVGDVPAQNAFVPISYPPLALETNIDIAVVGGGPAGLAAAISAAKLGARVLLFDENSYLGGHLASETQKFYDVGEYSDLRGFEIAHRMSKEVKSLSSLTILNDSTTLGYYDGGTLTVVREMSFRQLTPKLTILAPGTYERTMLFYNNELPGIFSASGMQKLMHIYGIRPGRRSVVASSVGDGPRLALQLADAGVKVEAVIELNSRINGSEELARVEELDVPVRCPYAVKQAMGHDKVEGVTAIRVDKNGEEIPGTEENFKCDNVCTAAGSNPAFDLPFMAGCDMKYVAEADAFLPTRKANLESVPGVFVIGEVCCTRSLAESILEGRVAGLSAGLRFGYGDSQDQLVLDRLVSQLKR